MRTWEDALNPCGHADVLADRARALAEQRAVLEAVRGVHAGDVPLTRRHRTARSPWTAARIKALRDAVGCNQQVMADELGVCLRTYQYWESGFTRPGTTDQLERLNALAQERGTV